MNIGKGNEAFKIKEDGTITRIEEYKQKSYDWIWWLFAVVAYGGPLIASIVSNL